MENKYIEIDESTWPRAMHCAIFRNSVEPAFCVTFEADVTAFKKYAKENGLSFTIAMVYAVCKCANHVEAFRYRFVDGKVVLFDRIDTAFTYLNKETNLFKVVNVPMMDHLKEYCIQAKKTAEEQKDNATPLFDWGKYYEKDGKLMMPISVQGHHSFVDGIHVGEFVDTLEKYLNSFN
mgnify:CR=1 FL=1